MIICQANKGSRLGHLRQLKMHAEPVTSEVMRQYINIAKYSMRIGRSQNRLKTFIEV